MSHLFYNLLTIGLNEYFINEMSSDLTLIAVFGLSYGLSYWFLLGLYQGIAQERIEDQDRRVTNQGIHRSLHNSVIVGIIGGGVIGGIKILNYGLNTNLKLALSYGQNMGLLISISGALLICILTGGLAVWRHYVIRFLLWRSQTSPWKAPQFLNDADARFLLRRVGGGYSFTHRLLLDYFVKMETEATSPTLPVGSIWSTFHQWNTILLLMFTFLSIPNRHYAYTNQPSNPYGKQPIQTIR